MVAGVADPRHLLLENCICESRARLALQRDEMECRQAITEVFVPKHIEARVRSLNNHKRKGKGGPSVVPLRRRDAGTGTSPTPTVSSNRTQTMDMSSSSMSLVLSSSYCTQARSGKNTIPDSPTSSSPPASPFDGPYMSPVTIVCRPSTPISTPIPTAVDRPPPNPRQKVSPLLIPAPASFDASSSPTILPSFRIPSPHPGDSFFIPCSSSGSSTQGGGCTVQPKSADKSDTARDSNSLPVSLPTHPSLASSHSSTLPGNPPLPRPAALLHLRSPQDGSLSSIDNTPLSGSPAPWEHMVSSIAEGSVRKGSLNSTVPDSPDGDAALMEIIGLDEDMAADKVTASALKRLRVRLKLAVTRLIQCEVNLRTASAERAAVEAELLTCREELKQASFEKADILSQTHTLQKELSATQARLHEAQLELNEVTMSREAIEARLNETQSHPTVVNRPRKGTVSIAPPPEPVKEVEKRPLGRDRGWTNVRGMLAASVGWKGSGCDPDEDDDEHSWDVETAGSVKRMHSGGSMKHSTEEEASHKHLLLTHPALYAVVRSITAQLPD